jgi:hypothetical protein
MRSMFANGASRCVTTGLVGRRLMIKKTTSMAENQVGLTETRFQQLLEIWNKAKGKERDALLWGDEVCPCL